MILWGAAVAGRYPYIPSRHTIFLAPFAVAAVSALLASIVGQKLWRGLLIAALLMGVSTVFGDSPAASINTEGQGRAFMNAALNYVHESIPPNDLILVDYQSSLPVAYYLCASRESRSFLASRTEFIPLSCSGHSFVSLNYRSWELNDINFQSKFEKLVSQYQLKPGDRVWVFQTTWTANLDTMLQQHFAQFRCLAPKRFGKGIVIIPFVVSPERLPACGSDRDSASEPK
jgi:hypothetical protein